MGRVQELEQEVKKLYDLKNPDRAADWADWLFDGHVVIVADYASELAKRYGVREDTARAAALLHDIADAVMKREDQRHEQASLDIARDLLQKHGYDADEIHTIVDDAVALHSCHDGKIPSSPEGKVLATADSMAHLKGDFYLFATRHFGVSQGKGLTDVKEWALKKIDRDYNNKILFDDVRSELARDYEMLKDIFSR